MWTEKYKPTNFDEMIGNHEIIEKFKYFNEYGIAQNLLISGHNGTGRTTAVSLLIKHTLGDKLQHGLLRISTINEHTIQSIYDRIVQFIPKRIVFSNTIGKKIVYFENVDDHLAEGTQQILRRLMEQYSHNVVFILVCNSLQNIAQSIYSRCQTLKFQRVEELELIAWMMCICEKEQKTVEPTALNWIAKISDGNVRCCINYLQIFSPHAVITVEEVTNNIFFPFLTETETCVDYILQGNMIQAIQMPTKLYQMGFSSADIIMFIGNFVRYSTQYTDAIKLCFFKHIVEYHAKTAEGINSLLSVYAMIAKIIGKLAIREEDVKKMEV